MLIRLLDARNIAATSTLRSLQRFITYDDMVDGDLGSAARSWLRFHVSSPRVMFEVALKKLTSLAITQSTSALCSASSC
jgi:hypothetical protein